jgi:hypothetical protein
VLVCPLRSLTLPHACSVLFCELQEEEAVRDEGTSASSAAVFAPADEQERDAAMVRPFVWFLRALSVR